MRDRRIGRWQRLGLLVAKAAVSGLFLALLSTWIDWHKLGASIGQIHGGFFTASYLSVLIGEFCIARRLGLLLRPTGFNYSTPELVRISFESQFYAIFLPAGIGQAAARWYKVTKNNAGRLQFVVVTAVEKILFLTTTVCAAGLPLYVASDPSLRPLKVSLAPIALATIAIATTSYELLISPSDSVVHSSIRRLTRKYADKITVGTEPPWQSLLLYRGRRRLMVYATAWTLAFQVVVVLRIALLFFAVGVVLPLSVTLWLSALVFLVQTLPVSLAGLGVREATFAYVFDIYGLSPQAGALVGLLFFSQLLLSASLGGVLDLIPQTGNDFSG